MLGTLSNREKLDWRSLAKSNQTCTSLWCTGHCPVLWLVRPANMPLSRKFSAPRLYSSDCPVCIGLFDEPAAHTPMVGSAISGRRVDFANGHQAAPDCPVCQGGRGCNGRLRQKRKEIVHYSLSGGASDCPVHPWTEGNYGLPNGAPAAPSCLGAICNTIKTIN